MTQIKKDKVKQEESNVNRIADVGVILSGFALILDTIPVFGLVLLGLSFVISAAGLYKKPRTNAWLGLMISLIAVLPLLLEIWIKR